MEKLTSIYIELFGAHANDVILDWPQLPRQIEGAPSGAPSVAGL
jgi:hypothetical protein